MGYRIGKMLFVGGLTLSAAGGAGYQIYKRVTVADARQQTVYPLFRQQKLLGVFANHMTDAAHLDCAESAFGRKIDISLRYISLREIFRSPETAFPRDELTLMKKRGGSLLLRLRIGDADLKISPFYAAKYAQALKTFAGMVTAYSGPIMIEPYFEEGTHGSNPEQKKKIVQLLSASLSSPNITWVWNEGLGDPPPRLKAMWGSLNITQKFDNGRWSSFDEALKPHLSRLDPKRSYLLFVASPAGNQAFDNTLFFKQALDFAARDGRIRGVVFFHAPTIQGPRLISNSLAPAVQEMVRRQFGGASPLPDRDILGNPSRRTLAGTDPDKCHEVMTNFYTPSEARSKKIIEKITRELEQKLKEYNSSSEHKSGLRQALAQKYLELATLEKNESLGFSYIEKARQLLKAPIEELKELRKSGKKPDRFPTVKKYFDLRFQLSALYSLLGDNLKAEESLKETMAELNDARVRVEQQINSLTEKGSRSRGYLELAFIYEKLNRHDKARDLYAKANEWATGEAAKWFLFIRGESLPKLRYIAAHARLGMARIDGKGASLDSLADILKWKEAGSERGFMDLGFEALILSIKLCLETTPDLNAAKTKLSFKLPWWNINRYADLKKALGIEDEDLYFTPKSTDRWNVVLEGLYYNAVDLPGNQRALISRLWALSNK